MDDSTVTQTNKQLLAAKTEQTPSGEESISGSSPEVQMECYILFPSHTDGWKLYTLSREEGYGARILHSLVSALIPRTSRF